MERDELARRRQREEGMSWPQAAVVIALFVCIVGLILGLVALL